jgi:hypothetical protein
MNIGLGLPESIPGMRGQVILEWARKAEAGPFSCGRVFLNWIRSTEQRRSSITC